MGKMIVPFDTETRSRVPIEHGRWPYVHDEHADIICMAYRVGMHDKTHLWRPGMPVPEPFRNPAKYTFMAHNIGFDWLVINVLGGRYGMGKIRTHQCVDVMALAARYGLPQSLDKLGKALEVKQQKLATGNALKKLFCIPPFQNPKKDVKWHAGKLNDFFRYCLRDVDTMCEIINKLPSARLSEAEQEIWHRTFRMNNNGVPVDYASVCAIDEVIDYYIKKQTARLPGLTDGKVTTVHQRQRIIDFAADHGVELENLQKDTVDEAVARLSGLRELEGPRKVHDVLHLRQLIGGAAIKKFKRLKNMTFEGVIQDNARYHGAGTGRTTGGGFQFLNLPRAKTDDPEILIQKFKDLSVLRMSDPMGEAKKLVRPMIKAPEDHKIMVADWGSIEYILLMYLAGEWEKVEKFRKGNDPYIEFASTLFQKPYEEVTDEERQQSKPPVLGGGYMLSGGALVEYAAGYGVHLSKQKGELYINTWRGAHPKVVQTWYALRDCAVNAVMYRRRPFSAKGVTFTHDQDRTGRWWLVMRLPSGRNVFYCQPTIVDGKFGKQIKHRGINPKTKQWGWVYLKPQRIIENVIQALGRCILEPAVGRLAEAGYDPRVTIYDEILCVEPIQGCNQRFEKMKEIMCEPPKWAKDLPLRASGFISDRFKKD
ncbi:MAG: DNA polymerase [Spirochaetaceae bacterium]